MLCPNRSQHWTVSSWWMQWLLGDPSTAVGIWKSQMTWLVIRWLEYIRIYAATRFLKEPPVSGTTCQFQSEADLWASYFLKNESVHNVKVMLLEMYYIMKNVWPLVVLSGHNIVSDRFSVFSGMMYSFVRIHFFLFVYILV